MLSSEREKRDAAKAAADQLSAHARAAETKEKQAEGEKKKADAQIAQLTAQLKAMTDERDGALADAEQKQGSLNEQLAWRQAANEPTITFLQAMMAHKLLTGCAPTSALGDAEFTGLANVQKNIESNKIPDLQRAARELAEVKEGLQAAGFLADAKVAVSANQVRSRRRALAPRPGHARAVTLTTSRPAPHPPARRAQDARRGRARRTADGRARRRGRGRGCAPGRARGARGARAEVAELGPFRDQAERLAREREPNGRDREPRGQIRDVGGRVRVARQAHQVRGGRERDAQEEPRGGREGARRDPEVGARDGEDARRVPHQGARPG